jgi:hypothetical protein
MTRRASLLSESRNPRFQGESLQSTTYVRRTSTKGYLVSRLSVAVGGGFLQSLVEATPARVGQTYLRKLYDEVHGLEEVYGKALYYTSIVLTAECIADLVWWREFLVRNPCQVSRSGQAQSLLATWGDGSGTGTGGTIEEQHAPSIEQWMGAWHPLVLRHTSNSLVLRHTSNWKEL